MTNKNDGSSQGPGKPVVDPGAKKPTPIIDLKATEVAGPAKAAATASGSSPSAGAASSMPGGTKPNEPIRPTAGVEIKDGRPTPASAAGAPAKSVDARPADDPKPAPAAQPAAARQGEARAAASQTGAAVASAIKPATPPRSGGGFLSHTLAGIAGGLLALLGADTIGAQLGLTSLRGTDGASELATRLGALEQTVRSRPAAPSDLAQKVAAAESRLARLDEVTRSVAQLADLQTRLAGEQRALDDKLAKVAADGNPESRLALIEDKFKALAAAAGTDAERGRIPQLAALTGQIKDLEATLNTQISALRRSVAQDIETRVAQTAEVSEAAKSGSQRLDRDLATVKTDAARLESRFESLKTDGDRLGATLRTAQEEIAGIKGALDGLKVELATGLKSAARPQDVSSAIAPITTKLASVEQNLQGVVKGEEDRRANAERIVLALELGNLKRALDRGGRYAGELAEVQKASGGRLNLAALEKFKDQGAPSLADISRDFRQVAHAMLDAEREPADAGVVDRLLASAKSVVRVRKVSHAADDKSTEAVAGRIETLLRDGRLVEVIEEGKKLTPKALAPAKDWLGRVEGRAAIDRAVGEIEAQLKTALGGKAVEKVTK